MKKERKYQTIILVLSLLVILQAVLLLLMRPKKMPPRVAPPSVVKGKIAIVLDDWGYNLNSVSLVSQIKYPLTISILPNLAYSRQVAEELHRSGFEIILHLPMEPLEKSRLEKDTILTTLSEKKIREILERDLKALPYVRGVSNHMGSKASSDLRTMSIVFQELRKRNLYFLDSLVSARSVCADLAKKIPVAFAKRNVFLDNQEDPVYIRRQLEELKIKAGISGQAIGIGHDRKKTLETLKSALPELEKEGYRFVYVSELIK